MLRDVDLHLPPGTVAEITGRNGAGKSTLLRLLAGVTPPTRGRITDRPEVVGYAPEIFPVEQPFTVLAYLTRMAAIRGLRPAVIDPWVDRLGMAALLDVPLADLSKGSAHKVGLAQALLAPPGLLILDEPFSGLDAQARAELPRIVADVAAAGGVVVVSDHQSGLAGYPGIRHLHVGDATVQPADAVAAAVDSSPASGTVVIEITVDAADAEAVAGKLRAEGYQPVLRTAEAAMPGRPMPEGREEPLPAGQAEPAGPGAPATPGAHDAGEDR
ncbi:ATP-binding cassette domain-containing protein [Sphaerisporangium melleum]|uniref:ATP-binding cassette domain-containing protein n=1 Tax=Sphaerisporangium melleum TaxID=321316 RepID=UPI001E45124A|nr:ATP-binding cassette domain-containing protein [Sphaerisporangium melleum]